MLFNSLQDEHATLREQLEDLQKEIDRVEEVGQEERLAVLIKRRGKLALRIRDLRLFCQSKNYNLINSK